MSDIQRALEIIHNERIIKEFDIQLQPVSEEENLTHYTFKNVNRPNEYIEVDATCIDDTVRECRRKEYFTPFGIHGYVGEREREQKEEIERLKQQDNTTFTILVLKNCIGMGRFHIPKINEDNRHLHRFSNLSHPCDFLFTSENL